MNVSYMSLYQRAERETRKDKESLIRVVAELYREAATVLPQLRQSNLTSPPLSLLDKKSENLPH